MPRRPFSNGTEFMDWYERNCSRCTKCYQDGHSPCDINNAIAEAFWGRGMLSDATCERVGFTGDMLFFPACQERDESGGVPTEEYAPRAGDVLLFDGIMYVVDTVREGKVYFRMWRDGAYLRGSQFDAEAFAKQVVEKKPTITRMYQWPGSLPGEIGGSVACS